MGRLGHQECMVDAPDVGLRVKATFLTLNGEVEHLGLVLPPTAPKHITIKLDNGYNVSFPNEALHSWDQLDQPAGADPPEYVNPEADANLPRVRLIHTGGTIASKVDYATGAVEAKFEPQELLDALPELSLIHI